VNSNLGYAELVGDETKIALIPTPDEVAASYGAAIEIDGAKLVKGRLQALDCSPADLRHKARILKPDADFFYMVEPFRDEAGHVVDLVWIGGGFDAAGECVETASICDWGWSRGVADILNAEALAKPSSEDSPLLVFQSIGAWLDADRAGACVLKPSARKRLSVASHVRLSDWSEAADIVAECFPDNPGAVSGPQDRASIEAHILNGAFREISRHVRAPYFADPWGWLDAKRAAPGYVRPDRFPDALVLEAAK
jgi:hypothetical protein